MQLENLLKQNDYCMYFGRSRHAQYGKCQIVSPQQPKDSDNKLKQDDDKISVAPGDRILVTLLSDAIFLDKNGYTVDTATVREEVRKALNIAEEKDDNAYTEIEVKELTGYYGVWNLKRQAIPVVCAGSTFEFLLAQNIELKKTGSLGEKIGEGFGMYSIIRNKINKKDWGITGNCADNDGNETANTNLETNTEEESEKITIINPLLMSIQEKKLKTWILKYINAHILETKKSCNLNSTTVGQLTLMLDECLEEAEKEKRTPNKEQKEEKASVEKQNVYENALFKFRGKEEELDKLNGKPKDNKSEVPRLVVLKDSKKAGAIDFVKQYSKSLFAEEDVVKEKLGKLEKKYYR